VKLARYPRRWAALLGGAALLLAADAAAQGGAAVILQTQPEGWAEWARALEEASGEPVRLGALEPWPGDAPQEELQAAAAHYQAGVDQFLDLKLKEAVGSFQAAQAAYLALAQRHPFDAAPLQGAWRSGFYRAWARLEADDRRAARDEIAALLDLYPEAVAEEAIFPPPFRARVEEQRKRARRRDKAPLPLSLLPAPAQAAFQGAPLPPAEGGERALQVGTGGELAVGGPGLGLLRRALPEGQEGALRLDLVEASQALPRLVRGLPLAPEALGALGAQGSPRAVAYLTDASPLRREGALVYLQALPEGALTGAFLLPPEGLQGAAGAPAPFLSALQSPEVEVVSWRHGEGWVHDEALAQRLSAAQRGEDIPEVPVEEPVGLFLGLQLGAGLGIATEVTDPGLAPSLLVLRVDMGYRASDDWDLGLGARVQPIPEFTAALEPYLRWRASDWLRLRAGVMLGQITHQILRTENRDRSSSGFVGPALGVEVPLGWFQLGLQVLAPLYPSDPTVHADALLGLGIDL
jgi:hypothetical protein